MIKDKLPKTVCVFCAADDKIPDDYKQLAFQLGQELASHGFSLLSGGNNTGLMNAVNNGHSATAPDLPRFAVIPEIMRELALHHPLIPEQNIIWTIDMYARLQKFYELCDYIVILPGGYGTLHELMDCLVLSQFGVIKKHLFLFNFANFWDPIIAQFNNMVSKKTLCQKHLDHLFVVETIPDLLAGLHSEASLQLAQGFADGYWKAGK